MLLEGRWGRQAPWQRAGGHGGHFLLREVDEPRGVMLFCGTAQ